MWISKKRFEEMEYKLDVINERLNIVISKTIEEPDCNKSESLGYVRNSFLETYPVKHERFKRGGYL